MRGGNGSDLEHRSLAQGALRLEEVFQSLRENAFDTARDLQQQVVARSIQQLKQKNAGTQRQLQALKQKVGSRTAGDSPGGALTHFLSLSAAAADRLRLSAPVGRIAEEDRARVRARAAARAGDRGGAREHD